MRTNQPTCHWTSSSHQSASTRLPSNPCYLLPFLSSWQVHYPYWIRSFLPECCVRQPGRKLPHFDFAEGFAAVGSTARRNCISFSRRTSFVGLFWVTRLRAFAGVGIGKVAGDCDRDATAITGAAAELVASLKWATNWPFEVNERISPY